MKKLFWMYIIVYFLLIPAVLMARGTERTNQLHREAQLALTKGDINEGIAIYEKIIKQNKNQAEYYWLLDDVLKQLLQNNKRIELLQKLSNNKKANSPEQTKEKLGLAYFDAGNYDSAMLIFNQLKQTRAIKRYISNCEKAKVIRNNPIDITITSMGENINTMYDNIWPGITADNETFSFTVVEGKTNPFTNPYAIQEDIYQSTKQDECWQKGKRLSAPINTADNEGSQHFSADGRYMFFVGCNRKEGKGSCDIYYSIKNGDSYSAPINPGEPLNTIYWESTPSFSACGKFLYFSSNRPGSIGGKDIWRCEINILPSGQLTFFNAQNMGDQINTSFDEMAPFIHPDNIHLYFSSNGHPGLGGFDVFQAKKDTLEAWNTISNMGYPINTFGDEIGFIISSSGEKAYLSSNQHIDIDNQHLNRMIYEITLPHSLRPETMQTVKGVVIDNKTNQPLQANIEIFDIHSQKTISRTTSDNKTGTFTAIIPQKSQVGMFVKKDQYLVYSEQIDSTSSDFYTIKLEKIEKGRSFVLRNIYFDFDSAELLSNSYAELHRLLEFLQSNPTLNITLIGHTDNFGNKEYNRSLSIQRARSVYNYLLKKGIDKSRLQFEGKGADMPIEDNNTDFGRSRNRRIEFVIH